MYNRGVNKRKIFLDSEDYAVFLSLLKRYLDERPSKDYKGRQYPWLHNDIKLLAFCLMPNHFHFLVYQKDETSVRQLLKNVCGSYTIYFNKKYRRVGPLFQDRFKASMILRDDYLQHISRYIHLNPRYYKDWEFSSLPYYLDKKRASWIDPKPILELFDSPKDYETFTSDYEAQKAILDEIKQELAT
ncbi:MAG: transposase [Candidatus Saccharimonadales bacterium]